MEVKFYQAKIIKISKNPIELQEGCHLAKVKGIYFLVKTHIIEIDYPKQKKQDNGKS